MEGYASEFEHEGEEEPEITRYEAGRTYTQSELNQLADIMLREHAASPPTCTCPPPGQRDNPCTCPGARRGIGGDNPILFKEHEDQRKKREIYTTGGTPDPSLVQGIYNRTHPQGRKVNTPEQRKKNGASYFK